MPRPPKDITDAELNVLQALWDQPGATIRQLTDRLYGAVSENSHFATVQKLLERMQGKGFVRKRRDASPQQFAAAVSRQQLIGRRLSALADSLCGGSVAPLISTLIENPSLSDAERRELRGMIEKLDGSGKPAR